MNETKLAVPNLRVARPADAPALSALMRSTFMAANGHCTTAENLAKFLDACYTPEIQLREIRDPGVHTVLVEERTGLRGYAQLRWTTAAPREFGEVAVELGRIYLIPEVQRSGIGSELMQYLLRQARVGGASLVWLNVWQESAGAIDFYRKHGFQIVGETLFEVGNESKEDWLMTRSLGDESPASSGCREKFRTEPSSGGSGQAHVD